MNVQKKSTSFTCEPVDFNITSRTETFDGPVFTSATTKTNSIVIQGKWPKYDEEIEFTIKIKKRADVNGRSQHLLKYSHKSATNKDEITSKDNYEWMEVNYPEAKKIKTLEIDYQGPLDSCPQITIFDNLQKKSWLKTCLDKVVQFNKT